MGIEENKEIWTRVDLYCDDPTTCVQYGNPEDSDAEMPMVADCCQSANDAHRLTLHAATRAGWQFDLKLQPQGIPLTVNGSSVARTKGATVVCDGVRDQIAIIDVGQS